MLILIFIGMLVLAGKLYSVQIVKGNKYSSKADSQYSSSSKEFDRGSIFFESKDNKLIGAAKVAKGFSISMNPSEIENAQATLEALSEYIELDQEDFLKKAARTNSKYELLAEKVDDKIANSVKGLKMKGISVTSFTWRIYPGKDLASHVLGIVGEDERSAKITGRYGLERKYDGILGRTGESVANIFAELFGGYSEKNLKKSDEIGDIVTSIEPTAQKYVEDVLGKANEKWDPDQIGAIIMDPKTGQIVAMASLPDFDPNETSTLKNISVLSNPIIESSFELGSIMKPLTMAIALDTKAVTSKSTYDDTGSMTLDKKEISNYDGVARGIVPMQEILSQSLNVGAATIALKVGKTDFISYLRSLGFGEKTGIDAPNESSGQVGNFKTGRDIEIATMAYGQGIALSPIAATRALASLANGGYIAKPHFVDRIMFSDGSEVEASSTAPKQVFKRQTVEDVTTMLVKVVDEKMSKAHPALYHEHFSIAAKTGTAGIPDPKKGGYYDDRYLHSFFGYFPAYNPKFIVFIYQVNPKGATYASETLVAPFSDIASFLIDYYGIAPDR